MCSMGFCQKDQETQQVLRYQQCNTDTIPRVSIIWMLEVVMYPSLLGGPREYELHDGPGHSPPQHGLRDALGPAAHTNPSTGRWSS